MKVFKYDKKASRQNSYFNGKERIGYKMKDCPTDADVAKAVAAGWTRELPTKTKKVQASVTTNSTVSDTIESPATGTDTDTITESVTG